MKTKQEQIGIYSTGLCIGQHVRPQAPVWRAGYIFG